MNPRGRLRRVHAEVKSTKPTTNRDAKPRIRHLAAAAIGMSAALLFDDTVVTSIITGILVSAATEVFVGIWWGKGRELRRESARHAIELPFALDVLAAALRAGLPVTGAFDCAARSCAPSLGCRLASFSQALRLGASAVQARSWLDRISAGERVATAVERSLHSGAMLADSVELLACELREEQEVQAQTAAQRTGVWMVLPLCLCFLPAFVIAGLVPVVLSTLNDVLHAY